MSRVGGRRALTLLALSVAAITTSEARGTPATPLLGSIRVSSMATWVPKPSGMS